MSEDPYDIFISNDEIMLFDHEDDALLVIDNGKKKLEIYEYLYAKLHEGDKEIKGELDVASLLRFEVLYELFRNILSEIKLIDEKGLRTTFEALKLLGYNVKIDDRAHLYVTIKLVAEDEVHEFDLDLIDDVGQAELLSTFIDEYVRGSDIFSFRSFF